MEYEANLLCSSLPDCSNSLLGLLIALIDQRPRTFLTISRTYYSYLSSLFSINRSKDLDKNLVLTAIKAPLLNQSR
jgi:ubiquitin-protein ligase E3 C